jgi:transcriptional regulator with XRE-family HTH domain
LRVVLNTHYGSVLRAKRKAMKRTQEEMAKSVNSSDKFVRELENSTVSCKVLDYINILELNFDDVFNLEFKDKRSAVLFDLIVKLEAGKIPLD